MYHHIFIIFQISSSLLIQKHANKMLKQVLILYVYSTDTS